MSGTCSGCGAPLLDDGATYGPRGYPLCIHCWLARLRAAGLEAHLWTPAAWHTGEVERVLRGDARA